MLSSSKTKKAKAPWTSLPHSLRFLFREKQVLLWSLLLSLATIIITWITFSFATDYIDSLSQSFFIVDTSNASWWITVKSWLFSGLNFLYLIGTRLICFYLSFLMAYTLTSPGYFFLSTAAEKIYLGQDFDPDDALTLKGTFLDLLEGIKIALVGIGVTLFCFTLNFVPVIGHIFIILIYTFYSALIFIDYPASRKHWSLRKKMSWIKSNRFRSIRLGIFPALIGLIPVVNIFGMALIFPIMTVHATLNFSNIEKFNKTPQEQ